MMVINKNSKRMSIVVLSLLMVICCFMFLVACNKNTEGGSKDEKKNNYAYENTQSPKNIKYPWEEGGKKPSEYTWEEFEALSGPQQIKFQDSFGSTKKFNAWMHKAQVEETTDTNPWEKDGAKKPSEYTWKEFDKLTGPQQIEFQRSFDTDDGFDKWLKENEPK